MKISDTKTREMLDTAERHYINEQRKSGMISPIPYVFIRDNESGSVLIYSNYGTYSSEILKKLEGIV